MTFMIVMGFSSNYCGNERCKTAYIHTYNIIIVSMLQKTVLFNYIRNKAQNSKGDYEPAFKSHSSVIFLLF